MKSASRPAGGNQVVEVFLPKRGAKTWTYLLGDIPKLSPGDLVHVPFTKSKMPGIVTTAPREHRTSDVPIEKLKAILQASEHRIFDNALWQTISWMSRYYLTEIPDILEKVLPWSLYALKQDATDQLDHAFATHRPTGPLRVEAVAEASPIRSKKAHQAWALLQKQGSVSEVDLQEIYSQPRGILNQWLRAGWVKQSTSPAVLSKTINIDYSTEQRNAIDTLFQAIDRDTHSLHLVEGVTGSGKTEVYIAAAHRVLQTNRNVLFLVPEIALARPLADRIEKYLGIRPHIWHSAMAKGKRSQTLQAIFSNQCRIVVGARSAVFAPLSNLGLIIVDEEHDLGYVQSEGLNYHTRDVANQRSKFQGTPVIYGSATPSLDIASRARKGQIGHAKLTQRFEARPLPDIHVIDLTQKKETGPLPWLSKSLHDAVAENLRLGQQTILFRNRRGYHPLVVCTACQEPVSCQACDTTLALHSNPRHLRCHICNDHQPWQDTCPSCGKPNSLKTVGAGTQRIAHELEELFPDAVIDRLDRDQVTSEKRIDEILGKLTKGETDILVGTQMVSKGLDIENITLVGIVSIDGLLLQPDFRSAERTLQQVCQVSGRAGRGKTPGRVLIQTLRPEDNVLQLAMQQDFDAFYDFEIQRRQALQYPPSGHLCRLIWEGKYEEETLQVAKQAISRLDTTKLRMLGPAPAPLARKNQWWRVHALVLCEDQKFLYSQVQKCAGRKSDRVRTQIVLDPQAIF